MTFSVALLLCRLYVTVITTIRGYGDLFWTDVVAQMDAMNDTVLAFQAQAKKLPKVRPLPVISNEHMWHCKIQTAS